jgi:hypothetical protein
VRGHHDLERASVAAVLCALAAIVVPWEIVRALVALPLALFLPGYAIAAAAFGSRSLPRAQLLVLSLGMSLATLALGGILLNVLPGGLRTVTWALLLVAVVLAACRGAALRRRRHARRRRREPLPRLPRLDWALLGVAAIVATAAFALAQKPLPAKHAIGFTALWMLPSGSPEDAVDIGVASSEQDPGSFTLKIRVGKRGKPRITRFALDPGEERTFHLAVPSARPPGSTHVTASLFKQPGPDRLYRRVSSWLPRKETLP